MTEMLTHCKYQVHLPGHYFPGYTSLTREGVAFLVNGGTAPYGEWATSPEFLERVDQLIADLQAGKIVSVGAATLQGMTASECL